MYWVGMSNNSYPPCFGLRSVLSLLLGSIKLNPEQTSLYVNIKAPLYRPLIALEVVQGKVAVHRIRRVFSWFVSECHCPYNLGFLYCELVHSL